MTISLIQQPANSVYHRPGLKRTWMLALLGLLGACSMPVPQQDMQVRYRLNPPPAEPVSKAGMENIHPSLLRINRIIVSSSHATPAMIYSRDGQVLGEYRDSSWSAPPAVLIADALEQGLLGKPWVAGVLRAGRRLPATLEISCSLDRLEHHAVEPQGSAHLAMACLLTGQRSEQMLAHWRFDRQHPVMRNNAHEYVAATQLLLNDALGELLVLVHDTLSARVEAGRQGGAGQ